MEERNKTEKTGDSKQTPQPIETRRPWSWREVGLVVLLMVFVVGLRAWQMGQTAVASRDSIAFIHYAWLLDHQPWTAVFRSQPRHPGYPVAAWAMSKVLRCFSTWPDPLLMQASAQWTSGLASVLLVIPLYGLGRTWFGRAAGVGSVFLFQCLPTGSLILADGLSEGLFLLGAATALWTITLGLRDRSPGMMAWGGLSSGLAYLVRPEGAMILAAGVFVLGCRQIFKSKRQPWGRLVWTGTCLAGTGLLVALPLIWTTGKLTPKTTANIILQDGSPPADGPVFSTPYLPWKHQLKALNDYLECPETIPSLWLTRSEETQEDVPVVTKPKAMPKPTGLVVGTGELVWELLQGVGYFVWLPVLVGVWVHRRRLKEVGGEWVFFLVSLGILVFIWRVAVVIGYVSDRHLLLVVLGATLWAAAGLAALARGLAGWLRNRLDHQWIFAILVVGTLLPFVSRILQPLHSDRAGYRTAGLWLAEHCGSDDLIVDPHCWAAFYAGKAFRLDDGFRPTPASQKLFVVLNAEEKTQSHLLTMPLARQLATRGEVVYRTGTAKGKGKDEVIVYAVPLPGKR